MRLPRKRMTNLQFSLSNYDSALVRLIGEVKIGFENADPILGQLRRVPVVHDGSTRQVSGPQVYETSMRDSSAESLIDVACIRKTDVESFRDFLWTLCDSLMVEMKKGLFEVVSKVTEATGNVYDSAGRDFWDSYIEMIKGIHMIFDENGNHNYNLYLHPDTAKRLQETPPTPEQVQTIQDVINQKREEYNAQKRTRRLS